MAADSAVSVPEETCEDSRPGTAFSRLSADWFTLPLRVVVAWVFFSAAWRRTVLDPGKLDMSDAGWIGHKVNQFYPHALLIKGLLGWALHNPSVLAVGMVIFTVIEFLVGLGVLGGLLSRISAIGVALLSFFMLLGAGWLGATCLDEWQIGCWGLAGGLVIAATGPGRLSLDHLVSRRFPTWTTGWRSWFTTGQVMGPRGGRVMMVILTVFATIAMLWTNQAFAGGVWGPLHNNSAKPHVSVSDVSVSGSDLTMTVYRDGGPDTYGGYVTEVSVLDAQGNTVADLYGKDLAAAMKAAKADDEIANEFPSAVAPGPDGMSVPLGARAAVTIDLGADLSAGQTVVLRDVSVKPDDEKGLWTATIGG